MKEYKFLRVKYSQAEAVTRELNDRVGFGWRIVSHADDGDREWTFLLERERTIGPSPSATEPLHDL